jgi:peroxiredoxin
LRAYQDVLPRIQALGAVLVAVSPQLPDGSLSTAEQNRLDFDVLSDVGNVVARRYGLVFRLSDELVAAYRGPLAIDLEAANGDDSWELPVPGTFLVDREGVVRLAFVDPDYRARLEPAELLAALRAAA